jgi:hypothetical protein
MMKISFLLREQPIIFLSYFPEQKRASQQNIEFWNVFWSHSDEIHAGESQWQQRHL